MRIAYLDSSAIVKLSSDEPGSLELVDYLSEPLEASTSCLAEVEVPRALRRDGIVSPDSAEALKGFFFVSLNADVRRRAAELGSPLLRSLDAIHLASALSLNEDTLEFVTYDERMAKAARALGLKVIQPGL